MEAIVTALPVLSPLALMVRGFCVLAVDQFHVCALFKLSIVFVPVAAVIVFIATLLAAPPIIFVHAPFSKASNLFVVVL